MKKSTPHSICKQYLKITITVKIIEFNVCYKCYIENLKTNKYHYNSVSCRPVVLLICFTKLYIAPVIYFCTFNIRCDKLSVSSIAMQISGISRFFSIFIIRSPLRVLEISIHREHVNLNKKRWKCNIQLSFCISFI